MLSITRNPHTRQYELNKTDKNTGEIVTIDSIPVGFGLAFHLAFRMAQKHPITAARAWKAAQLVEGGHVEIEENPRGHAGAVRASVTSQDGSKTYYLSRVFFDYADLAAPQTHKNHKIACTCQDYRYQNAPKINGQPVCKHIMAVVMVEELHRRAPAPKPEPVSPREAELARIVADVRRHHKPQTLLRQYATGRIDANQFKARANAEAVTA